MTKGMCTIAAKSQTKKKVFPLHARAGGPSEAEGVRARIPQHPVPSPLHSTVTWGTVEFLQDIIKLKVAQTPVVDFAPSSHCRQWRRQWSTWRRK